MKHPLLKWLFQFQLDDSKSIHEKRLFHQTSIEKWLFGAPGCYVLNLYMTNITPVAMTTSYVGLDHSSSGVHSSKYLDVPVEVRISGVFHLYIVIYKWGILGWNNPLILTFHFLGHPNIFSGGASTVEKSSKHLDLHQIHRRNQQEVLGPSKKQLKVYQPTHSRSSSKHWNHLLNFSNLQRHYVIHSWHQKYGFTTGCPAGSYKRFVSKLVYKLLTGLTTYLYRG